MSVKVIPDGYHAITPHLICQDTGEAIEFYKRAFSATALFRAAAADGKVMHAEIQIGGSRIMLADEFPEMGYLAPLPGAPLADLSDL
ncbi:MAG: VOC family protein [Deltaproteobacteria bacterium]